MIKGIIYIVTALVVLAIGLSIYLQPNSFALCPYNNDKPSSRAGCGSAEAIVVVSGGDTPARTQKAINLYKHGWAPTIIFSGAAEDKNGPSNAVAMRQDAVSHGVPPSAILLEEQAENTNENARNTEVLLERHDITNVILVTSGYHQRRTSLEFKSATKDGNVTIRNAPTSDKDWGWWWWLTPRGWILALGELVRIIVFYVTGGFSG